MLVLSRRQNERINFPSLGITVEVLRTGNRKVQLGIDAPANIRVVRDELAWCDDRPLNSSVPPSISDELNSVAMAIRLSQNQIQQGLNEHAEVTLNDAIHVLQQLEERFSCNSSEQADHGEVVRERSSNYAVSKSTGLKAFVAGWLQKHLAA